MRHQTFLLGAWLVAGCAPESVPGAVPVQADGYTITGTVPSDVDVDELVADLPAGAFAVVGNPETAELAVIQAAGPSEARVASAEFSAGLATCPDCVGSCASTTRTVSLTLNHDSGINGETYGVQTFSATNFSAPASVPAAWTQNVGAQQTIATSGTIATCSTFSYFFDVTGPDPKGVFVSLSALTGGMGGVLAPAGADQECQDVADSASLGGTWMAWLSSAATSPAARFTRSPQPYVLIGGGVVANDWADLVDGSLSGPINRDQNGASVGAVNVWTGTTTAGAVAPGAANAVTCTGFTSSSALRQGVIGVTGAVGGTWTSTGATQACNVAANLLCFEQ